MVYYALVVQIAIANGGSSSFSGHGNEWARSPPPRYFDAAQQPVSGLKSSPHEWGFDASSNRVHPVTTLAVRFISLRPTVSMYSFVLICTQWQHTKCRRCLFTPQLHCQRQSSIWRQRMKTVWNRSVNCQTGSLLPIYTDGTYELPTVFRL